MHKKVSTKKIKIKIRMHNITGIWKLESIGHKHIFV
jgi:hypothetical protein